MEIYPGFAGIVKDYDSLNNKPTIGGKAIQGELISDDYVDFKPAKGSNKLVTSGGVEEELEKKADEGHSHDDRYYTEAEADELLKGKSDSGHSHDDRYYTEAEVDKFLKDKSPQKHTHDDRYYTSEEIDDKLRGTNLEGHNHDDMYYTETEMDNLLDGKSDSDHLHDMYLTEEDLPSPPEVPTKVSELINDAGYVDSNHSHDGIYYTEAETDTLLSGKSDTSHTHDSRYYTESEVNTLLGKKSDSTHSHTYSELSGKPTIDGKELSGNVTTDGLMYKRILTSADDMDELFEDGVYVYSTSSLPKNAPFKNAAVIEVFGARSTTTQKIQRAYRYGEAGHSAFRPLYAGAWSEWTVAPTEYVTENGQSGGLYYKKWKSGAAEIWGKVTYTASSAVAAGGEYEFDIALPFACTDICAFIHANTRVFKVRKAYPLTVTRTKVTVYTKLESSEALSEGATIDYILNIRCNQA